MSSSMTSGPKTTPGEDDEVVVGAETATATTEKMMTKKHPIAKKRPIAAVAQMRTGSDKVRNLSDAAACARMALEKGASMLFLPECFGFLGESGAETLAEAEDPACVYLSEEDDDGHVDAPRNDPELSERLRSIVRGSYDEDEEDEEGNGDRPVIVVRSLMDGLRTIARESGLWISGTIQVAGAPPPAADPSSLDRPRVYNAHVVVDSNGSLVERYDKIHLFDISLPDRGIELAESRKTAPGTKLVAVKGSPLEMTLGLTVCYDLRFPEVYARLASSMGARVLLVPSAFTVPTGAAHWHALLRARAIDNQCYVVAAAQYGIHNGKRESFGHSLIVDPWGRVIADAGGYPIDDESAAPPPPEQTPSVVTAEIDSDYVDALRERMPIAVHRSNARYD